MITLKDHILNFFLKRPQHFFPLLVFSLMLFFLAKFILTHQLSFLAAFILTPYLLPLATQRLILSFYPIEEGASYIGLEEKKFQPWLFSLRVQQIYLVFPQLERLLFFLPGMYSAWLRAWGSKIGKSVFWTPGTIVNDRSLMEVGDFVVFGHNTYMSSHFVRVKNGKFFVYVKKIKIGSFTFVGAFTRMGPGTEIAPGSQIQATSQFSVNQKFPNTEKRS